MTLTGVPSRRRNSSIIGRSGRIGHDDHHRLAVAAERHEAVAQHQIGRDRAEELLSIRNWSMSRNSSR